MRFEIVKAIFIKELKESLRDRRSLIMMFGIPLVLYPLLALGFATLGTSRVKQTEEQKYSVAVTNAKSAPQLIAMIEAKDSGLTLIHPEDPAEALSQRKADALLILPERLEARAIEAEPVKIGIELDRSRNESGVIERKVESAVAKFEQWVIKQRLSQRNIPDTVLRPVDTTVRDVASASQRMGRVLAGVMPVLLLVTGMLGAFFPALNATTTERETGTLETLLVTPARKVELLVGKGALVLLSSFLTAALNLISMSLVMWRILSTTVGEKLGTMTISPGGLMLTYLAAMPTLIFFTALVMIVGLFARSFREANSFATPVMLLPMLAMVVSISDPPTSTRLLVTPVVNTAVVIRDVLTSRATVGAFLLAFGASCLYAGLMLSAAGRIFTSERLVNPTWEPLSLRGLRRSAGSGRRIPAIDEAIVLFAIVLLLMFYVGPSLGGADLVPMLAESEVLLIAGPALVFGLIGRYRWREVFSLWRPPTFSWLGAALMGVGLGLAVELLIAGQARFWKPDPVVSGEQMKLFAGPLLRHPILVILLAAASAGVCEELLFRGPIQSALAARVSFWPTALTGSLLFAAIHLDAWGMPVRVLISLFLVWLVYRTRSIFPAMIMHGMYDATQLALMAWQIRGLSRDQALASAAESATQFSAGFWLQVGVGAAMLVMGWLLCRKGWKGTAAEARSKSELAGAGLKG